MIARRIPNLLVPGTQKSGTTFLSAHLRRHPKIYFSKPKEPQFFSKKGIGDGDFQRYLEEFFPESAVSEKGEGLIYLAEGSTTYFQRNIALDNVLRYLGKEVKAIICVRHPIEKAVSLYLHHWRRKRLVGTERIIDIDGAARSVFEWTLSASHAERWIKALGRKKLLFLRYELLKESPEEYVRTATEFLEIEALRRIQTRKINKGFALKREGDFLVPVLDGSIIEEGRSLPSFRQSDLEFLLGYFKPDIERMEDAISIDLSSWKVLPKMDL